MDGQRSFQRIVVDGRIHLGHRRDLVQEPVARQTEEYRTTGAGPSHAFDAVSTEAEGALGQALEFRVADDDAGELYIEGGGLVTSYGIFGAPGCGKTVLLKYLLEQLFRHEHDNPSKQYGALILDPKAALVEDVTEMARRAGRLKDLRVIGRSGENVNVIDCTLDAHELGAILVLAGRSAGIDASDPFWFQEWSNLFASSLGLLRTAAWLDTTLDGERSVTLQQLLDVIFDEETEDEPAGYPKERTIQRLARTLRGRRDELGDRWRDTLIDVQQIQRFFSQEYVGTIEAFITKAYGMFRQSRNLCYSCAGTPSVELRNVEEPHAVVPSGNAGGCFKTPFYEDIVEEGRIVLVSIPPSEPVLAKTLCTLVKCLFQRTVLARRELLAQGVISNGVRPVVIACDEYSEIASEVPGQSMGDGQFLALAREYGCMAILATQSVNVLQASSLRETWRSVFSNFAAKIYMRLADNETAEEATKLAGESDWRLLSRGTSLGQQGRSSSKQRELRERKNLPSTVLTQVLKQGEGVVVGALDGGRETPGTRFLKVPFQETPPAEDSIPRAPVARSRKVDCAACVHCHQPAPVNPFGASAGRASGQAKAERDWLEKEEERRAEEQRRVDEDYQFHYEPWYFAWCSRSTPTAADLERLGKLHHEGNAREIDAMRVRGLTFYYDPTRGEVKTIYPLCIKLNPKGACDAYRAKGT